MSDAGLIIDGRRVPVPGVRVVTWEDDPDAAPRVTKGSPRPASSVTAVVLHTSRGRSGVVVPGARASDKARKLARYQVRGSRKASWHITISAAGTVYQQADAATFATWHASQANGWSVGIELAQDSDTPDLTGAQVDACVAVVRALCSALNIPAWVPARHHGGGSWSQESGPVRAWQSRKQGGESLAASGVIGHRNLTTSRGKGDPGDGIFLALLTSGFACVEPAAMTAGGPAPAAVETEEDDAHDEDEDAKSNAPARPLLPSWVDPALEVDASRDLPDDLKAFIEAAWDELAALGVFGDARPEIIAHCATECGRGRRAHGHNMGGVKLKERDDAAHRAKHGRGLAWWRDLGHHDAGDDEVELYRAFDSPADFWAFFVKRYAPRNAAPSERYAAAGRALWGPTPGLWFVELIRAGYRGEVRQRELAALADPEAHPSVVSHRRLVARVREMLR